MGGCWSIIDDRKYTGNTEIDTPNGDRNSNTAANNKATPPRAKRNHGIPEISTIDDPIVPRGNSNRNADANPLDPILLPNNPNFTCSANGRNGWLVDEVYECRESVRMDEEDCLGT